MGKMVKVKALKQFSHNSGISMYAGEEREFEAGTAAMLLNEGLAEFVVPMSSVMDGLSELSDRINNFESSIEAMNSRIEGLNDEIDNIGAGGGMEYISIFVPNSVSEPWDKENNSEKINFQFPNKNAVRQGLIDGKNYFLDVYWCGMRSQYVLNSNNVVNGSTDLGVQMLFYGTKETGTMSAGKQCEITRIVYANFDFKDTQVWYTTGKLKITT